MKKKWEAKKIGFAVAAGLSVCIYFGIRYWINDTNMLQDKDESTDAKQSFSDSGVGAALRVERFGMSPHMGPMLAKTFGETGAIILIIMFTALALWANMNELSSKPNSST